jgi:di/tricarboxylate transporter
MVSLFQGLGSNPEPLLILVLVGAAGVSMTFFGMAAYYSGRLVELERRILDSGDQWAKRQLLSERVTDSKENSHYWLIVVAVFAAGGVALLLVSTGPTIMINGTMFLFACAIGSIIGWYLEAMKGTRMEKDLRAA